MIRYWPLSAIKNSRGLHHSYVWELTCAYDVPGMPINTLMACNQAAAHVRPCFTPLVIVHTEDAPMRRVYLDYPTLEDFDALERGGFHADGGDTFGFLVDALH